MSRLKFNNLPLIEVIIRLAPKTGFALDLEHVTRVTAAFDEEFPQYSFLDTPLPSVATGLELAMGQLIGVRFENTENGCSLFLQPNLVAVAWQNRTLESTLSYVGYDDLKAMLIKSVATLNDLFRTELAFKASNLAYTNFIATEGLPNADHVTRYFGQNLSLRPMQGANPLHELNAAWHEDGNDLRIHLRGMRGGGLQPNGIELTSIAGRILKPEAVPAQVLDELHDRLTDLFPTLLTETAMKEWGFCIK